MGFGLNLLSTATSEWFTIGTPEAIWRVFHRLRGSFYSSKLCPLSYTADHDLKLGRPEAGVPARESKVHGCHLGCRPHGRAAKCLCPATRRESSPPPHFACVSFPRPAWRALEPAVSPVARFPAPAKRRD